MILVNSNTNEEVGDVSGEVRASSLQVFTAEEADIGNIIGQARKANGASNWVKTPDECLSSRAEISSFDHRLIEFTQSQL